MSGPSQESALEDAVCFRCDRAGSLEFVADRFGIRRCPSCELVFVSPRLDVDSRNAIYDASGYFEGNVYSSDGHDDDTGVATFLQRRWAEARLDVLDRHRSPSGAVVGTTAARLLEVGCAYGLFAARAVARGWDVRAVDVSEVAVGRTRQRLGIDVHHGLVDDAPFEPASFDAVVAWDVIEHVADPAEFLRHIRRLLTPDGMLALSLPNFASWPARWLRRSWWGLRPSEHIWQFTPSTLCATLGDAGFTRVAVTTGPRDPANLGRWDSMVATARPSPRAGT